MGVAITMAVQAAQALQQHVDGHDVGDHQVGIAIQADLQGLRAHQYPRCGGGGSGLAESPLNRLIQLTTVLECIAAMVQGHHALHTKQGRMARAQAGLDGELGGHRLGHGVAQHQHAGARRHRAGHPLGHGRRVAHPGQALALDAPLRRSTRAGPPLPRITDAGIRRVRRRQRIHRLGPATACFLARPQQAGAGLAGQRGRHQQTVATRTHMAVQRSTQQGGHVGVRGMHLVHHHQRAQQDRAPQMRMLGL